MSIHGRNKVGFHSNFPTHNAILEVKWLTAYFAWFLDKNLICSVHEHEIARIRSVHVPKENLNKILKQILKYF